MGKRLLMVSIAALAVALWADASRAVITGTAHETGAGVAGACSACHIPHGGGAQRLWPAAAGTGTYVGVVAPLCASCHSASGGYSESMGKAVSDLYAFGVKSHGTLMNTPSLPWGTNLVASNLPYTDAAYTTANNRIECTSCHNVHDDTNRPFLRDTITNLCARCHTNRHYVEGGLSEGATPASGQWLVANTGSANPGSHPVGTDVTGEMHTPADSAITIPAMMGVKLSTVKAGWSLGPHRTGGTTGGVHCVTCHAVHGAQSDADDASTAVLEQPNANFLAVEQAGVTFDPTTGAIGGSGRTVANGSGDFNALCEACHGVGNNPATSPLGAYTAGTFAPLNSGQTAYRVNPGAATTFGHPVDDYPSSVNATSAFPANWPAGNPAIAGTNVTPVPVCESCHAPHPQAAAQNAPPRLDVAGVNAKAYILRDTYANICNTCHSTANWGAHHPVNKTYNSQGVVGYLGTVTGLSGDTLLCQTCHGTAGGGAAHNWGGAGLQITSGWKPANNGRSATQSTDMYNADMSKTCMDCHYQMDGHAASLSPTLGTAATVVAGETEFQKIDQSMGTHYIGKIYTTATNWKGTGGDAPLVNMFNTTQTWAGQSSGNGFAPGWSRFGGNAGEPVLVCESCHELQPSRNANNAHLLLGKYLEGQNGDADGPATDDGRDQFCEACHGIPPGTHAVSGKVVSRTGTTLETGARAWLRGTPLGDATWGSNKVSCDSCHQTHDAATTSYTFILDAPPTLTIGSTSLDPLVGTGTVDGANPSATTGYPITTYATPTLTGKGGNFTGYCDQCHTYAY